MPAPVGFHDGIRDEVVGFSFYIEEFETLLQETQETVFLQLPPDAGSISGTIEKGGAVYSSPGGLHIFHRS